MDINVDLIVSAIVGFLPEVVLVILAVIGSLHLFIPIVQKAVQSIVALTPSKKDDEIYEEVVGSKAYVIFVKVVGYLFSLKLNEKVKKKKEIK